jgi:hypothetical protein
MVYGKERVFDADRLIDLLNAFESFTVAAGSARGDMDTAGPSAAPHTLGTTGPWGGAGRSPWGDAGGALGGGLPGPFGGLFPAPLPVPAPLAALLGAAGGGSGGGPFGNGVEQQQQQQQQRQQLRQQGGGSSGLGGIGLFGLPPNRFDLRQGAGTLDSQGRLREALRFVFSQVGGGKACGVHQGRYHSHPGRNHCQYSVSLSHPLPCSLPPELTPPHPAAQEGSLFRAFIMEELVKSIDALSREQLALLVARLGLSAARVPVLLPGAAVGSLPLAPVVSEEDRKVGGRERPAQRRQEGERPARQQ